MDNDIVAMIIENEKERSHTGSKDQNTLIEQSPYKNFIKNYTQVRIKQSSQLERIKCDRISENGSKSHIFCSLYYIYYCNMNSITFSTLFHIITWNLMLKLSKLCNKYFKST